MIRILSIFTLVSFTTSISYGDEGLELQYKARQIIAHKCWKCHGSEKDEGDLQLHTRKHIIDSKTVDLKNPSLSKILQRINLPAGHKEIMPLESDPLSKDEINTLTKWIDNGMPWDGRGAFKEAPLALKKVDAVPNSKYSNPIDQHVDQYFKQHQIKWKPLISDRIFVRKAYLDAIGILPNEAETKLFLEDKSPDKRKKLVQNLLTKQFDYQKHWLSFWNDLLRNDYTGTGFITKGRHQITNWLKQSLEANKPYDVMVREIFSPNKHSRGFIAGIRWRGTVSASQTIEMQAAQNSAQAFLGVNIKCASCHDSFTSNWKLQQAHEFASMFNGNGSIDINRCDKPTGKKATAQFLYPELGKTSPKANINQRLKQVGDMMTSKNNGRFARTIVNRYWRLLMGRGIIFNVDEMDSKPWSQDVLDDLAYRFIENNYDLKWLITEIMSSDAYQLPTVKSNSRHELASDDYIFRGPIVRRLTAEQFADAISYTITPIYGNHRNGVIIRASEKVRDPFQTALGRPTRENVTSTRAERGNLLESLELTNGTLLDTALKNAANHANKSYSSKSDEFINQLFLRGLQRPPSAKELELLTSIYQSNPQPSAYHDIIWIFINLPEFQSIL